MPERVRTAWDRLTPAQQDGILGLMAQPTMKLAAQHAGVNVNQMYRWLNDDDFNRAFREVRWAALRLSITTLAKHTAVAAHRLYLVAKEGQFEKNQVEASKIILEFAFRGVELEELAGRIESLERAKFADEGLELESGAVEDEKLDLAVQSVDSFKDLRSMNVREETRGRDQ
jgi:hypothetical protein